MNPCLRFRPAVLRMAGYTPGEQPRIKNIIKLNTNENAFPPSPAVKEALRIFDYADERRYPDPMGQTLREEIASRFGITPDMVILANGSDDTLTITARCFLDRDAPAAYPFPTYSLYSSLAEIQDAPVIPVDLKEDFTLPDDFEQKAAGASIVFLARPNAPTGVLYPKKRIEQLCESFRGAVFIDEAYADFASDNCADLVKKYDNLIVSRTFSKSRSLAGLRFGFAMAAPEIITEMMKVKDSYNVSMLTQKLAMAALKDDAYTKEITGRILAGRTKAAEDLKRLGFRVIPSETNFLFASPPKGNAEQFFLYLRTQNIIVRYFPGRMTGRYVRITIGRPDEMEELVRAAEAFPER